MKSKKAVTKVDDSYLLSPSQARFLNGLPKSEGDKSVEKRVFSQALSDVLSGEVVAKTENGKVAKMDVAHLLAIQKISYDLENPDNIDLLQYSKALGEQQNSSLDVNITIKPSQAFEGTEAKVVRHDVVAEEDSK